MQDEARRSLTKQLSSLSEKHDSIKSQCDSTINSLQDALHLLRDENARLSQAIDKGSRVDKPEMDFLCVENARLLTENASLQQSKASLLLQLQGASHSDNLEVSSKLKDALADVASARLIHQQLNAQNMGLNRELRRLSDELDSFKDLLDPSDHQADLQKLQSLRWSCMDATGVRTSNEQRISALEASVFQLESQATTLKHHQQELIEQNRISSASFDSANDKVAKYSSSLTSILSLCEGLTNLNDDNSSSFSSKIQELMTQFHDVPCFSHISRAILAISSTVLSADVSHRVLPSIEPASSDGEIKVLRFKLSSLASQLKRAEKVIHDLNARNDAQEPNAVLAHRVSELEVALRSMTSDRDDAMKRYLSIVSSLQSTQEQLHVVAVDFVTLRRNESQLCLELRSHNNADSSAPSPAATIAGIRQRLARQRDAESADIQREVEELLREWGEGSCDGQLSRLDLEAVRSAKKRSMLKEQNDMIVQLQSELKELRKSHQFSNTSASLNAPLPVSRDAILSPQLIDDVHAEELRRKLEFCETERRSSAILVDSLSQRLAEEENSSQELKTTVAMLKVDCSIAQVHFLLIVFFKRHVCSTSSHG